MAGFMVTEVPLVERHFLDWTWLLCSHQWGPPEAAVRTEGVHSSCLCPPTLWWQQNYCTLWENFEVKTFSSLFSTSLLLPLQFYLSYKLCTVCPLEIVWFLSFMLSKGFFFLLCFRWLCMVRDSERYLWGFDLLPFPLKSSQSISVFCFAQNHISPIS